MDFKDWKAELSLSSSFSFFISWLMRDFKKPFVTLLLGLYLISINLVTTATASSMLNVKLHCDWFNREVTAGATSATFRYLNSILTRVGRSCPTLQRLHQKISTWWHLWIGRMKTRPSHWNSRNAQKKLNSLGFRLCMEEGLVFFPCIVIRELRFIMWNHGCVKIYIAMTLSKEFSSIVSPSFIFFFLCVLWVEKRKKGILYHPIRSIFWLCARLLTTTDIHSMQLYTV